MNQRNFCAFILTHGRARSVKTYRQLRTNGYTGRIVLLVDDMDKQLDLYRELYGDEVHVFDKRSAAKRCDSFTNSGGMRAILFARNVCFDVAKELGVTHFIQLDDDYNFFFHRFDANLNVCTGSGMAVRNMDAVFAAFCDYLDATPILTLAFAQGGDTVGGVGSNMLDAVKTKRKAMNSFICRTDRRVEFAGLLNEDVNAYVVGGQRGQIFLTVLAVTLNQMQTQANAGGLTEAYLDVGTYVKSFYSVMCSPSSVRISFLASGQTPKPRIHHVITWKKTAVQILREAHRKPREPEKQQIST